MSRFTDHADLFERRHPRAARVIVVAILIVVAVVAFVVDRLTKHFGIL
ncbi:hypothetical protein [Burkholderia pyrrocinia]|nr:hypothetical protein [Burkholderia pyrrocinia]